jgi:hypothetical protein
LRFRQIIFGQENVRQNQRTVASVYLLLIIKLMTAARMKDGFDAAQLVAVLGK